MEEELRARLRAERVLHLSVKVIPKSPRTEFAGRMADGAYKVRVAAAAEKGRANAALIEFLAASLGVGRERVVLVAGETSQRKQIRVSL
ncbi:MAG TPA: DUF167 domain-containing protein [Solibacterales bacterium]|nr:DUF167 domain-containing protein [Bryobacterales bacterium]